LFDQYRGISTLIEESKTPYCEIAVIFRNNSSADGLEATLREKGIACKRKGSSSFFDSKEIKVVLDLFTISLNSRRCDATSLSISVDDRKR